VAEAGGDLAARVELLEAVVAEQSQARRPAAVEREKRGVRARGADGAVGVFGEGGEELVAAAAKIGIDVANEVRDAVDGADALHR